MEMEVVILLRKESVELEAEELEMIMYSKEALLA
jgi:hypothetical protein